ncbi:anthranilate synthase family protein [Nocardiopsis changdeensis]|uniref:anthranilate synthase n=1 Tax=Nocardiopsis changdeensis TaxID=2831969 RepID=A0ABX8BSA9_9ACTN|nr:MULTISPECIES: anthranilate synthase family protein [Nocardiopsis]QUX25157.1 chorismate-binding protein [Nocardiopsis changdeensis]QYX35544.1 anthranilate synthase family protein [Nocardiopsis sp. MT53]
MSGTRPYGGHDPFAAVLSGDAPAFALLYRPETSPGEVEVLTGETAVHDTLADLPLEGARADGGDGERHDLLVAVPYRQIRERGFDHIDDGAPLVALRVTGQGRMPLAEVCERVPDPGITLSGGAFDVDDDAYAEAVRRVVTDEIGRGEGANFVLKRSFTTRIDGFDRTRALALFRRLLEHESGTYWTFVLYTPEGTFVGATPERHVSVRDGTATMNPISGTYRYPPSGPSLEGVLGFLDDGKETDELYMVVDEELKMMARICDAGVRVHGPRLKEMARLAHTEYLIEGRCDRDPREVLRETAFAPTVTGSPLENACRVIARYEGRGRGHYSGALALIGRDRHGRTTLDSAIMIRTAEISPCGGTRVSVGATLVRHSDPASEVAETHAKVAGVLGALKGGRPRSMNEDPRVREALRARNTRVSDFWLGAGRPPVRSWEGLSVLVVDAEDTFTAMLAHQLESIGPSVAVRPFAEDVDLGGYDLVVLGPGPGDPRDASHPKIARLRAATRTLLESRRPFLAVCLSHQVLCLELGLEVAPRAVPNQGAQHVIDLFGRRERVGFYNTFAARCAEDKVACAGIGAVEVSRDAETGEVHALRGPWFGSLQFHAESLLTQDGVAILSRVVGDALEG